MEQILLAYGLPKETVTTIMMFYKNTIAINCSADGDTDFFDIVVGVLQRDTSEPFLLILYKDYVLQMLIDLIKENGLTF